MNKWDVRFSDEGFFYGKNPNVFFADYIKRSEKKGRLLLPGEGEGRNAVFAAKQGWAVDAFDSSSVARRKALKYASDENVEINYNLLDISAFTPISETYDLIALVFVHLPEGMRKRFHQQITESLKQGGTVLIESFAKEQIHNHSGGPPDEKLLYSLEILKEDFGSLKTLQLCRQHQHLDEGHHHGMADLVRLIAKK